jgi:hypothetical protein
MFDRVQLRALAGKFKDIQRLVPKPLLRCLGCVLRVAVLLEGEPSLQAGVLSPPEQVFIKDLSAPFIFPSILTSLPIPAAEKHPPQYDAATTMLHRRDGARFPSDVTLGIQAKQFNLSFIRPENLASHMFFCIDLLLRTSAPASRLTVYSVTNAHSG